LPINPVGKEKERRKKGKEWVRRGRNENK